METKTEALKTAIEALADKAKAAEAAHEAQQFAQAALSLAHAAAALDLKDAEIERMRALCIDYAVACGELSKGLAEDDPMWAELKALGDRIGA